MEKLSKKLGDDEVKNRYIMLPHGKEKMFPKDDFKVDFGGSQYDAYVFPYESKVMGSKKIWEHKLMFREPHPDVFHFGKTIVITGSQDSVYIIELN